jgi:hypothetical protein
MAKLDNNKLPEWVEINAEWVIQCTRGDLWKLGNWCSRNVNALAVAVFATAGVNTALAQTTPVSSSPSATLQETKGYWQEVTLKDGSKVNFADIAKMGSKEQEAVIEQVSDDEADRLEKFMRSTQLQVANQEADNAAQIRQVANQKATEIDMNNIEKMNQLLGRWVKLNNKDKAYLEWLSISKRPPIDQLAKKILANPQNFA